jgi:hypothetical protein
MPIQAASQETSKRAYDLFPCGLNGEDFKDHEDGCVRGDNNAITYADSYRPERAALRSTKRRLDPAVSYESSKQLPAAGPTVGQRAGKEKLHIWGNHVPVVVVFRVGCQTQRQAEWQEYQCLSRN